mmetsp:Transcript_7807/g.25737  ORF Transcript_7807/g.25737 Transcript_7807/m.25737 type:complete len:255 (-) Transcript_7807:108-872(-)
MHPSPAALRIGSDDERPQPRVEARGERVGGEAALQVRGPLPAERARLPARQRPKVAVLDEARILPDGGGEGQDGAHVVVVNRVGETCDVAAGRLALCRLADGEVGDAEATGEEARGQRARLRPSNALRAQRRHVHHREEISHHLCPLAAASGHEGTGAQRRAAALDKALVGGTHCVVLDGSFGARAHTLNVEPFRVCAAGWALVVEDPVPPGECCGEAADGSAAALHRPASLLAAAHVAQGELGWRNCGVGAKQ